MMAAAASAALDHTLPRLPQVHETTRAAAKALEALGYALSLPVQTNMVVVDLEAGDIPPAAFVGYCKEEGVSVFPNGRLVFHHQTSDDGVRRLLRALELLMAHKKAGKELASHKVYGGYT